MYGKRTRSNGCCRVQEQHHTYIDAFKAHKVSFSDMTAKRNNPKMRMLSNSARTSPCLEGHAGFAFKITKDGASEWCKHTG